MKKRSHDAKLGLHMPIGSALIPRSSSRQRSACSRACASPRSRTLACDHARSATAAARGHAREIRLVESIHSDQKHALIPASDLASSAADPPVKLAGSTA